MFMGQIRTFVYSDGALKKQDFPISEVSKYLKDKSNTVWVDYLNPEKDDLDQIALALDLHDLAIEDALHSSQRPKVDYYSDHLFLACHALRVNNNSGTLDISEVDTFIKDQCVVTVRKNPDFDIDKLIERWNASSDSTPIDASYLLYSILDTVIDGYLEVVLQFDDYYDGISDKIFSDAKMDITKQKEWFTMRKSLVQFHRVIISMREAINILLRREHHVISDEMLPYFHDTYDHLIRVAESTDVLRELVATIVDTNLNLRDYRQNQIMKQVTSWAAIIAVPTLVTGYYGMNIPFPGYGETSGVYISAALIIGASLTLYSIFRRKDWI